MKADLSSREDIDLLVRSFYDKVMIDQHIGFLFTRVVRLDLSHHLPLISDFWEMVLLGNRVYHGNPMDKHFTLHEKEPLKASYFLRWLELWTETVNELFEGPIADEAIMRAKSIAGVMKHQLGITS